MSTSYLNRLGEIDFSRTIERLAEGFTGREWLFTKLDKWLNQENGEQFYLLTGEPGVGKSAIAAQLTQRWADKEPEKAKLAAYHFCRAGDVETVRPGRVLRSLATQLGKTLPHYGEALKQVLDQVHVRIDVNINIDRLSNSQVTGIYVENLKDLDPREEFRLLIQAPLAALSKIYTTLGERPPALKVFLIDSLDEAATTTGQENMVTLLASLYQARETLPPWVRFLLTARPDQAVLSQFLPLQSEKIEELKTDNLSDIQLYIQRRVDEEIRGERSTPESPDNTSVIANLKPLQQRLEEADLTAEKLIKEVKDLSHGNFLYTKLLLNSIASGEQSIKNLATLPKTLNDIYHRILRYRCSFRGWLKRYQPILGTLSVTQEPISQAQLSKFIGIKSEDLAKDLAVFQQFLDESKVEQGQPLYTIFHQSLREYLLDRKYNHDFWCDAKEQHESIINCFEDESKQWQDLILIDSYGLRHLAQHLVKSKQVQKLHMLLKQEKNERNAWFEAKDISSFQTDIRLAWEQTVIEPLSPKTIALQLHYTLITASLNSLVTQIPDELLVAAVKYGHWSPQKGISFALQIPDPQQKVAALTQLSSSLPPALKIQALQIAIEILSSVGDERYKTEAFTKLIPKLTPELLSQALDLLLSIENRDYLKASMSELLPRLNSELISKTLKTFFTSQPYRLEILTAIAPHLDKGNLWPTAFESIPFIQDNKTRAYSLLILAKELPLHPVEENWWTGIFESIESIFDGKSRSEALAFLTPIVPVNYLEYALEIALTTWYFFVQKGYQGNFYFTYDSQALEAIAPKLSSKSILKILDIELFKEYKNASIEVFKQNILENINQDLLKDLDWTLDEAVETFTWKIPNETYAQAISVLAPYLRSNSFPQVVETLLDNCSGKVLVRALTSLVPHYPRILDLAYKTAQNLDSSAWVLALIELTPLLPITELQVLETSFKEIENSYLRYLALNRLVPYLPEAYSHVLQAAKQIEDELTRSAAVKSMEPSRISLEYLPLILELAFSFNTSEKWINIQSIRAGILIHFLPYLPELFSFAWETVLSINGGRSFIGGVRDEDIRVKTTREFVSAIPEELISQALDVVIDIYNEPFETKLHNLNRGIGNEEDFEQAFMLEMLAPRITLDLLPKAIKAACAIIKFERRDLVLSSLAIALPEYFPLEFAIVKVRENPYISDEDKYERESKLRLGEHNRGLIYEVASAFESQTDYLKAMTALAPYFPEVSDCFCSWRIIGGEDRIIAPLLQSIAHHLGEEYLVKAINTASRIENIEDRIKTLLKIANYLSPNNRDKILDVFQSIKLESNRSKAITQIIPMLPKNEDLFNKVFANSMSMSDDKYRLPMLVALIPYVSEALPRALEVSSSVKDYYRHSQSLLELSKYLPEVLSRKLLNNSLTIALNIPLESSDRVSALSDLAPFSDDAANNALDAAITYEYCLICFSKHLKSIARYLANNKEALVKAFETAKSLSTLGGDKYEALLALTPYLPEAISELKNAVFSNGYIGKEETLYLVKLAPHLLDIIPDAFKAILSNSNRFDFIEHLEELIYYFNAEHMLEALTLTKSLDVWSRAFTLKILLKKLSLTHPKVFRKLAKKYTSKSISFTVTIIQDRSWIKFLEKIRVWQQDDLEIFFQVQEILESIEKEAKLFYIYPLTELNRNFESGLIKDAIDKPLLWDFTREIIDIFIKGIAPFISHEFLSELLEDDPSVAQKAVSADYAIRLRRHASVFLAPYLLPNLFEKALEVSMLVDDPDRAKILKVLIPKLPENKLSRAKITIDSIENVAERTELLIIFAVRCNHLLIDALQSVFSLSSRDTRAKRLNDLLPYLQLIPPTNLLSFWTKSLESLFPYSRAEVFGKIDVLAPVAQQLGGEEVTQSIADSIDCVTRWWK